ncbi:hypothetical protein [Paraflavitalea sp. CAU 1676]|uniref:hypothetical protein n=1 Tax=Paraflavitalea sp. CAU 1676 TaxID=3032598 RepID=UPI0023DA3622|nr:hypothetical protein [Paraflavitalea sp. CAU 1676]MDF2192866.1 hypothetical protein [Paraflavitalea sp. CAU 1676]
MKKFATVKTNYLLKGVTEDNIDYAISAVKEGTKREFILENLTADYRGMDYLQGTQMLEELFAANGGEFKKENRGGIVYGIFFLIMGFLAAFYIFYVLSYGGILFQPVVVGVVAVAGILGGLRFLYLSFIGSYRDSHEPLNDYNDV